MAGSKRSRPVSSLDFKAESSDTLIADQSKLKREPEFMEETNPPPPPVPEPKRNSSSRKPARRRATTTRDIPYQEWGLLIALIVLGFLYAKWPKRPAKRRSYSNRAVPSWVEEDAEPPQKPSKAKTTPKKKKRKPKQVAKAPAMKVTTTELPKPHSNKPKQEPKVVEVVDDSEWTVVGTKARKQDATTDVPEGTEATVKTEKSALQLNGEASSSSGKTEADSETVANENAEFIDKPSETTDSKTKSTETPEESANSVETPSLVPDEQTTPDENGAAKPVETTPDNEGNLTEKPDEKTKNGSSNQPTNGSKASKKSKKKKKKPKVDTTVKPHGGDTTNDAAIAQQLQQEEDRLAAAVEEVRQKDQQSSLREQQPEEEVWEEVTRKKKTKSSESYGNGDLANSGQTNATKADDDDPFTE